MSYIYMSKEILSPREKTVRNVGVIAGLTGIALITIASLKGPSDKTPEVNNNPIITRMWGLCSNDDGNGELVKIEWNKETKQITVNCLETTP